MSERLTTMEPQGVDDATAAFPANVVGTLLPLRDEIPREYEGRAEWTKVARTWFYRGLSGRLVPKDGVDYDKAVRHLAAIQGSWEPKHEHKEEGVAWLLSLWFDRYEEPPDDR